MYKITARVYGRDGHRFKGSFLDSTEFTTWRGSRVIHKGADKLGTHEYSEITIFENDVDSAHYALEAQLSDGLYENYRVGRIEIIEEGEI